MKIIGVREKKVSDPSERTVTPSFSKLKKKTEFSRLLKWEEVKPRGFPLLSTPTEKTGSSWTVKDNKKRRKKKKRK